MPTKQVRRGSPIIAGDFNHILGGTYRSQNMAPPISAQAQSTFKGSNEAVICAACNDGAVVLPVYSTVVVIGQLQDEGSRNTLLLVRPMEEGDSVDCLAVVLEEIPVGCIGRVAISGVCWAKGSGSGSKATLVAGDLALTRGTTGPIQVLTHHTNVFDGDYLLVRLGGGGSGSVVSENTYDYSGIIITAGTHTELA